MAGRALALVRDARWLTEERVVAYSRMAVACYGVVAMLLAASALRGEPVGGDYPCFWAAGSLALKGQAAGAYDVAIHTAEQEKIIRGIPGLYYAWIYPPIFLLPLAALALLPYAGSLLLWLALTALAYVLAMRRVLPHPGTAVVAVAAPPFLNNALRGQNGFLSAALMGGGLSLLDARPWLAGALLGALCYKPQLALLVPLALLAGRCWRPLCGMAASALALGALSALLFGVEAWSAFDASRQLTRGVLEAEQGMFVGKVGVFTAVRFLGGAVATAWVIQWVVSLAAAAVVAWGWHRVAPTRLKSALLVAATPLATPWANTYDLVVLALPVAWLIGEALQRGFLPWERAVTVLAAFAPVLSIVLVERFNLQLLPALAEVALIAVVVRRMTREPDAVGA